MNGMGKAYFTDDQKALIESKKKKSKVGGFAFYIGECRNSYGHGKGLAFYDRGEIRGGIFDKDSAKEYVVTKHAEAEGNMVYMKCVNEVRELKDGTRDSKRIS